MEHVNDSLSGYIDGQLPDDRRRAVEAHLADCPKCRGVLEELRALSRLVGGLPRQPLPPGFMSRLQRRLGAPQQRAPGYWLPLPARAAAFALSGLIIVGVVYNKGRSLRGGLPAVSEDRLRLSPDDIDQARSAKGGSALARAKGEPVAEPAAAAKTDAVTNEQLYADLEKQKERMGIRAVSPPSQDGPAGGPPAGPAAPSAAPPPAVAGNEPLLLKQANESADQPAAGQPVETSSQAAAAQPSGPKAAEGVVVDSDEDRQAAWTQRDLRLSPPTVNYQRNSLLLVFAPDMATAVEILGVDTRGDKIVVKYRLFPRLEALAARRAGGPVLSYQFRVVPKSQKPYVFTLVE